MLEILRKKPYGNLYHLSYIALALFLTVFFYFFCDRPLSFFISELDKSPAFFSFLSGFAHLTEKIFKGSTLFVVLIVLLIGMRLFKYKGFFYQFILMSFILLLLDNLIACVFKYSLGRMRPEHLIQSGHFGFKFFQYDDSYLSFPSGHSINIMVFASILMYVYPKNRQFILFIAAVFCFSRVWCLKHYVSDIFFGSFLVFLAIPLELYVLEKWSHYRYFNFIKPALEIFKMKKITRKKQ
jgi:membrane-associated phospholipid phosphatase